MKEYFWRLFRIGAVFSFGYYAGTIDGSLWRWIFLTLIITIGGLLAILREGKEKCKQD